MSRRTKDIITYSALLVVFLYFLFWGLVKAKVFLAPIVVAILLAMVVLPIALWLSKKGVSNAISSLISTFAVLAFLLFLGAVLSYEVKSFASDWPSIRKKLEPSLVEARSFIKEKTGFTIQNETSNSEGASNTKENDDEMGDNSGKSSAMSKIKSKLTSSSFISSAGSYMMQVVGLLGTLILVHIYIFFFLFYRQKFKKSLLKLAPDSLSDNMDGILNQITDVAKNYLAGKLILCIILAILYSIGLSVSGVKHAILISIIASFLTFIPYLGNVIGFVLATAMGFVSGNGLSSFIGVSITFTIAQFVESYVLEPFIVGDRVHVNPIFTIIIIVLGNAVWGILGMLVAIPLLGILKVIFDQIPSLAPLGYLVGNEDLDDGDDKDGFFKRVKQWALNKKNN